MAAGSLSVVAGVAALVPGLNVFVSPLRDKAKSKDKPIRMAMLEAVPPNGLPHRFPVIDRRRDAWTFYPPEPIGAVYLIRDNEQAKPRCFSATCPHLGCSVEYKPDQEQFQCPCHASGFRSTARSCSAPAHGRSMIWKSKSATVASYGYFSRNSAAESKPRPNRSPACSHRSPAAMSSILNWLDHRTGYRKLAAEAPSPRTFPVVLAGAMCGEAR